MKQVCKEGGFAHMHACHIGACYVLVQVWKMIGRISEIANAKPSEQDLMFKVLLAFPSKRKDMLRELKKLDS